MTHLDRLAGRAQALNVPLSALFELTGRCNLDCGHCYLDIANPPRELSTAEALHVVDQLADAGTLFLTLTGGEVFLRKDTIAIARHARARGLALRIFTNATRIDRILARQIAGVSPLAVEVSIYGAHAEAHDAVAKRPRTLRRTLRGLVHMRDAGVRVGLKAPLMAPVNGELDRLFALADRLGMPIAFDPFVTPRHDGDVTPLALRAGAASLATALAHPRLSRFTPETLPAPPGPDEIPCAIARRTLRISPTGDLYPCPTYPTSVGNVLQRPFADLWGGGALLDRLRAVRVRDLRGACAGCGQAGYCSRCSAVALLEHGDELGPADEACRIADAQERALGLAGRGGADRVRLRVVR